MEVKLDVDATGRASEGRSAAIYPFSYAPVPSKIRIGPRNVQARLRALKVGLISTCIIDLTCRAPQRLNSKIAQAMLHRRTKNSKIFLLIIKSERK